MTNLQKHIEKLRTEKSDREIDRIETYKSIKELEITSSFLVVEIQKDHIIVTR